MTLEELKSAADLAAEVSPETKIYIYSYKDKVVNRFAPLFQNDKEPKYMVDGLKTSILKGANIKELSGLALCLVGTFDLTTGKHDFYDVPEVLVDCDVLIEKFGGNPDGKVQC